MNLLRWFRGAPLAPVAQAYVEATPRSVSRKTPVDALRFIVLDTETTGFNPAADRILSIATLPVTRGTLAVSGERSWLIYQADAPMTDAVHVHGILPSETRTGLPEPVVLAQLLPVISGAVLVGHHVGFDVRMLNEALHRHFRIHLRNPTLDTAAFAMRAIEAFRKTGYPGQRAPSLDEVCTLCGIAPLERHTASGDAFTTAELLMVMCAKHARRLGRPLLAGDLPLEKG